MSVLCVSRRIWWRINKLWLVQERSGILHANVADKSVYIAKMIYNYVFVAAVCTKSKRCYHQSVSSADSLIMLYVKTTFFEISADL